MFLPLFWLVAVSSGDLIRGIDQAELNRQQNLAGYTVTEYYRVTNSHFQTSVQSRSGPSLLQSKILDRLLASEHDMSRGTARSKSLMTSANYEFKLIGEETVGGRACELVSLNPKAKSTYLVRGKAWLDAKSFILVRLEGKPTQSPSFFAGSPAIVREYQEIDGISVARQSRATTESFLLGKTEVTIDYLDYQLQH